MRTSKAVARLGGLALALGLGAVVIKRRRSLALADNAVADTATPHFEFTGQPSGNTTVAVTVLRAVGAVTDFLGIDFGTQIAPLMAFDYPNGTWTVASIPVVVLLLVAGWYGVRRRALTMMKLTIPSVTLTQSIFEDNPR